MRVTSLRLRPDLSNIVVGAQVLALAGVLWPGRGRWPLPRPVRDAALLAAACGGALSLAGIRQLGPDLTPRVEPRQGARLRTAGVYAMSRNPVYAGLLVGATAVAVLRRRPQALVAVAALSGVLHVKAGLEESRLRKRFGPEYEIYAGRVPRLIGLPRRGVVGR